MISILKKYKEKNHTIYKIFNIKISIKNNTKIKFEKAVKKLLKLVAQPCNLPNAKGKLRQNQLLSVKILSEVVNLMNNNNLTYWLDFGTLLGAVRHKGFIPWDSDIDICMLKKDFIKCIPLLKEYYKNSNIIVREFGYSNHFQVRVHEKDNDKYGLDIFPMEKYIKSQLSEQEIDVISKEIKSATDILKKKCKADPDFATDIDKVRDYINELENKIIFKQNNNIPKQPALLYGIDYPIPYKSLIKNYDLIFPLKTIEFEGQEYNCPNKIVESLIFLYGDNYMDFPKKFKMNDDKVIDYINSLELKE